MTTNKRYFWLKLQNNFFEQKEIKLLRKIAGGDTYTVIYLKMLLASLKDDGKLYFESIGDDFAEELALQLDEEKNNVEVTLNYLQRKGLLEAVNPDEFFLNRVPEMVGSESYSAERMRNLRKRQELQSANILEQSDAQALQSDALPSQSNMLSQSDAQASHSDSNVTKRREEIEKSQSREYSENIKEKNSSPFDEEEFKTYSLEKITNFMLANGFGSLNPMQSSIIDDFISDRLNKENAPKADEIISMILKAFELAKKNGSNNFNYVKAILNGWDSKGYMTLSDVPTSSYLKNDDQQPEQETKAMPSGVSELFNQFWSNYPKQQGKGQAVVEFANALNHGANAQEIITKAKEYADYVTAENTEMQFIKYPANWLKRQGWLDNYKTSINEQEDKLGW